MYGSNNILKSPHPDLGHILMRRAIYLLCFVVTTAVATLQAAMRKLIVYDDIAVILDRQYHLAERPNLAGDRKKEEKPMWWIEERRCGPPHRLGKETRVGQK